MITEKRKILSIVFLIVCIIPISINVGVVHLIIKKIQLRQARFYIIANLSVADTLTLLVICIGAIKGLYEDNNFEENTEGIFNVTARIFGVSAYINSILTTAFLGLDRYAAVKCSLQYETILTKVRAVLILCFIWIVSIVLAGIQWVNVKTHADYHLHLFVTLSLLSITTSAFILSVSKYTITVRKQHMDNIQKRLNYFGVEKEKFDRLKYLKSSLKDSFKLFVSTAVILNLQTILGITELFESRYLFGIKVYVTFLLSITDFLVLSLTQKEIKYHLKRAFLRHTRIQPSNSLRSQQFPRATVFSLRDTFTQSKTSVTFNLKKL